MTRVVAIVQARMDSSRFPGKMLAKLGDRDLLSWVLTRVCDAKQVDRVVLATSTSRDDDRLADAASKFDVVVVRGSQDDVLDRFVQSAKVSQADLVVRVCADNPFVAAEEIDRLVVAHNSGNYDYSCNHQQKLGNKYADGFGAEILSASLLIDIARLTTQTSHREHVTSYIWDNSSKFKIQAVIAPAELAFPEVKLDIDTPQELQHLNEFINNFAVTTSASAAEIVKAFNKFKNS
ncbi:MAG: NTP transferase domain-containing protein [Actinomycetota bacterium]|nr:NTP transferase domain-containing protein [Actinomycetota bacterium]